MTVKNLVSSRVGDMNHPVFWGSWPRAGEIPFLFSFRHDEQYERQIGKKSRRLKMAGLLPVFTSTLATLVLYVLDVTFLYEPKHLPGFTNTIFTAIIPLRLENAIAE